MRQAKYAVLVLMLCLQCLHAASQTIEWSSPQKQRGRTNYTRILGANSTGYYVLRCRNKDFSKDVFLERYKGSLTIDFSRELLIGNKSRFENIVLYEGGLLLLKSMENQQTNKIELLSTKVDENGIAGTTWVKIDETPKKSGNDIGDFTVVPSTNKSLLVASHTEYGSNNQSVLVITVFNPQQQQVLTRKFDLEYNYENLRYKELQIDDYGNVYFSTSFTNTTKKKNTPERKEHSMYAYFKDADKLTKYKLNEGNYYVNDFSFGINYIKKCLTICGYYSSTNEDYVGGTFLYNISIDSGTVFFHKFQELDKGVVSKMVGEREATKRPELSNIQMSKLILRSDGGMVMVGENVYTTQQTYTYYVNGVPQYSYRSVYNYDDIMVISLDPDGKSEWFEVIRKKQSSMNDEGYFSSFSMIAVKDKMHFLYNDNSRGNADVVDVTINNLGQREKNTLLNSKNTYALIVPSEGKLVSYNTLLLSANKDKQFSLLKISF
ncbi:MAG: hypothetical protein WC150_03520 [Bacteroidia bacterium]